VGYPSPGAANSQHSIAPAKHLAQVPNPVANGVDLTCPTIWTSLFPTIYRVEGRLLTGDSWLVGPVTTPVTTLLSVGVFVLKIYVLTAMVVTFFEARPDGPL
jgi:hypothetical protein